METIDCIVFLDALKIEFVFIYIIIFLAVVFFAFTLFVFKSRKKIIETELEKIQLENKFQQEAINTIINTQETERERIAQDLHDEISSKINVIFFQANMLLGHKIATNDIPETIQNIINTSKTIQTSARDIAHNLLPPTLQRFGLHEALVELTQQFCTNTFTINYKNELANNSFGKVPQQYHIHYFRIIQELINNSIKHGKATEVVININSQQMTYTDNGSGFYKKASTNGLGTINILNRAKILQSSFTIQNATKGIIANLVFP
jgi:signal transduction histidine kinase